MENSFEKHTPEQQPEHEKNTFEYSPENPPPLDVLESKIFAVHATSFLPKKGRLETITRGRVPENGEPASFRPTIHFALGELVQGHIQGYHESNWEKNPYAVITPLKELEGQLVNVSPHDTFVVGEVPLQKGMTLLVPKGTDTSKLPPDLEIKEYERGVSLRSVIDAAIDEKGGWHIQMKPDSAKIGSVAHIEDAEINDSRFFKSLFDKHPHISYGDHSHSERGDAFRFGVIDGALSHIISQYTGSGLILSTAEVALHKSVITHNLQELERVLKESKIDPQAMTAFEEKKAQVFGWLNIVECDLEVRRRSNETIMGANESFRNKVRQARHDPAALKKLINSHPYQLSSLKRAKKLEPDVVAAYLSGMSPEEVERFKSQNQEAAEYITTPTVQAIYASMRWVVIKDEQAHAEKLDQLLADSIPQIPEELRGKSGKEIFDAIKEDLSENSNRLPVALSILQNPKVKGLLENALDMHFTGSGPATLRDILAAHPETRILFVKDKLGVTEEQAEARHLLDSLGINERFQDIDHYQMPATFEGAERLAGTITLTAETIKRYILTMAQPMNSARNIEKLGIGETLTLYEAMRYQEKNALAMWGKIGLGQEFRKKFPTDADFWNSGESMWDIYKQLKTSSAQNNSR